MPSGLPACRPASRNPGQLMPDELRQPRPVPRAAPARKRSGHATCPVAAASVPFNLVEFFNIEVFPSPLSPGRHAGRVECIYDNALCVVKYFFEEAILS